MVNKATLISLLYIRWPMFEVVLAEAIIVMPIVTQEDVAVLAIPHCLVSLLLVVIAVVAASAFFRSSSGEMNLAEATCSRGVMRTAWSLSAGITTNQLLRQRNPKLLH
jgi:hypothetical protein